MARRKLNTIKFPDIEDIYYLDADKVEFDDSATYADGSVGKALVNKANIDGFYDELTAGSAEQLISSQFVEDSEPYKFRTTGGSADVGNREQVDAIVGGSIAWNQLAPVSGKSFTSTGSDTRALTLALLSASNAVQFASSIGVGKGIFGTVFSATENGGATLKHNGASADIIMWSKSSQTITAGHKYVFSIDIVNNDTSRAGGLVTDNLMLFDLTQMFGSSVADAVYNMEQGNAGAGVKWFKSLFPNSYYAYNTGELISVSGLQSHDTVGFNAYNPSTGIAKLLGGHEYQISGTYTSVSYVDDSGNAETLSISGGLFTPKSNGTLTVVGGNSTDTCVHLTWSGWRNGEYEPYQKHSYPLDSSLTLRGVPKLSADNKMYYDGDEYLPDGSVTRKYKIVTYNGSENWGAESGGTYSGQNFFVEKPSDALPYSAGLEYAQKFLTAVAVSSDVLTDNTLVPSSGYFNFAIGARLGITTVADFKTYLASHPISVLYPIATPTTETAEPYTKIQTCDDFGTEEYVSTSIVPVGHNTEYPANLRDKLQHLPDLADNDGYYMIKQASKQMSLEPFRIPKAPSENGTYVLKATVSGGTPTYTWVEEN